MNPGITQAYVDAVRAITPPGATPQVCSNPRDDDRFDMTTDGRFLLNPEYEREIAAGSHDPTDPPPLIMDEELARPNRAKPFVPPFPFPEP